MRNCSKANKRKVWRKTYGKIFLRRKALSIARMSVIAAQGTAQISAIRGASIINPALAAAHVAMSIVDTAKAINDSASDMNKGFARRY